LGKQSSRRALQPNRGTANDFNPIEPLLASSIPLDENAGSGRHRTISRDGKFLLYSVGWNETDDGGTAGTLADVKKGDWVWPYPQK
jgi:hypothetical protein